MCCFGFREEHKYKIIKNLKKKNSDLTSKLITHPLSNKSLEKKVNTNHQAKVSHRNNFNYNSSLFLNSLIQPFSNANEKIKSRGLKKKKKEPWRKEQES